MVRSFVGAWGGGGGGGGGHEEGCGGNGWGKKEEIQSMVGERFSQYVEIYYSSTITITRYTVQRFRITPAILSEP